ncbi:MAG TPA: aromatic amino acid transaminase, partial [Pseudoxanthomonas sp.]|nr:aromatic amino acid transaminase [Pseudoxanthomonas sp.]
YTAATRELLFGKDSPLLATGRVATTQTVGGSGALRVGAELLRKALPHATLALSNPSWENHRAVFGAAGFEIVDYTYFDPASHGVDFAGMLADLGRLQPGTTVLLHACCHNPTGADLDAGQWQQVAALLKERQLFPFVDMAYQGFDKGIAEDAVAIRTLVEAGIDAFVVSSSYSKSFSLYGERVGALSVVSGSADEARAVQSQVKRIIRTIYSSPSTHGAALVAGVLNDPELRTLWERELGAMRARIHELRGQLVDRLAALGHPEYDFIRRQTGMFSYSGLGKAQVERLRDEFGIYAVGTGRICLSALNQSNLDYVAKAISVVSRG